MGPIRRVVRKTRKVRLWEELGKQRKVFRTKTLGGCKKKPPRPRERRVTSLNGERSVNRDFYLKGRRRRRGIRRRVCYDDVLRTK